MIRIMVACICACLAAHHVPHRCGAGKKCIVVWKFDCTFIEYPTPLHLDFVHIEPCSRVDMMISRLELHQQKVVGFVDLNWSFVRSQPAIFELAVFCTDGQLQIFSVQACGVITLPHQHRQTACMCVRKHQRLRLLSFPICWSVSHVSVMHKRSCSAK